MELVARLAVLLACAAAAGGLYVTLARPARRSAAPGPPAAMLPLSLGGFVVVAAGTALTGAATIDPGESLAAVVRAAGVALLALAGAAAAAPILRRRRTAADAPPPRRISTGTLATLAWAGAALALVSWVVAAGTVVVALAAGLRVERSG